MTRSIQDASATAGGIESAASVRVGVRGAAYLETFVLLLGVVLRVVLGFVQPPWLAFDDHFQPAQFILEHQRLPTARDCWECYQPPLYYVVSAATYGGVVECARALGGTSVADGIGRKAVQCISVVAGCLTLFLCRRILKRVLPDASVGSALVLGFVAFLPQHVYMSAMATNDALTYFFASLAIYAALVAHGKSWNTRWTVTTAILAGLAMLCKAYGVMSVIAIVSALVWSAILAHRRQRVAAATNVQSTSNAAPAPRALRVSIDARHCIRAAFIVIALSLLLGAWPNVRNIFMFGRPIVDNFDVLDSPMKSQPPGSVRDTSFTSFRFISLLRHPWLHASHVDSFWTQLYARFWFDYENVLTTLAPYTPWRTHVYARSLAEHPTWNRARWLMQMDYSRDDVPSSYFRIAGASYLAGLPLTLCLLAGLAVAIRRSFRDFTVGLLTLHFLLSLFVPVFQTLRLPHFAAMKAAFTLCGVSSVPMFLSLLLDGVVNRMGRSTTRVMQLSFCLLLIVVVIADAAYVVLQAQTWLFSLPPS